VKIRQAKIKPQLFVIETPIRLKRQVPQRPRLTGQLRIVSQHHTAFARRNELVRIKAETTQRSQAPAPAPTRTRRAPAGKIFSAVSLRRVFDNSEPVLFGETQHRIHVHGMAVDMNRHDGARPRPDRLPQLSGIHHPSAWIGIHQNRNPAVVDDGKGAGDDRKRRDNDLVTGFESETGNRQLKSGGPIADGNAVAAAAIRRPTLLEPSQEPAG
jgi:hypothetical protein